MDRESLLQLSDTIDLGEWDSEYASVLSQVFDREALIAHAGSEPWGGDYFSDLQVRLYSVDSPPDSVALSLEQNAKPVAETLSTGGVRLSSHVHTGWLRSTLVFNLHYTDYGGAAMVDVYMRRCDARTFVLAFLYHPDPGSEHSQLVERIVRSASCGPPT